ncbi:hypothetical protein CC117_33845 [Parafrankia colletiae]|uniref:Uncharacterized protein n=2 Tax=Parafrankia colletiae TaxID=573497 RepID=A0A1S1R0Q9_9ACTN|nr:hypothetical protein CC117_33845 [Parafrankia colletiae]
MHTIIRRTCYVLLFGLVIEGALTFPLLAAWYGFPKLSLTQVCSELEKARYSDASRECDVPYAFPGPPLAGPAEAEGQTTARDVLGVQPKPGYVDIDFRELVKRREACKDFDPTTLPAPQNQTAEQRRLGDYCNYISDDR